MMSLIFDVPKHVLKPKSAPNVPTPKVSTPNVPPPKVPPPEIPPPEEISANEANISDAENFQNTFEDETPQTPPASPDISKHKRKSTNKGKGTPKRSKQTTPTSPDISKQCKRKSTNKGKGTPKRSKRCLLNLS